MTRVLLEQLPHEEVDLVRWKRAQIKLKGRVVPPKETRDYDNSMKDLRPAIETLAIVDDGRRRKETYKEQFIPVTM